jgi:DNA-binding CsgD family transcriptional regulator
MGKLSNLGVDDLAVVVRLLGELCEPFGTPDFRIRHVLSGLCGLVRADLAVRITLEDASRAPVPRGVTMVRASHGGSASTGEAAEERAAELVRALVEDVRTHAEHVATDPVANACPIVTWIRAANGVARRPREIVSLAALPDAAWVAVGLARTGGRARPFTERHRQLVHIVHASGSWLYLYGNGAHADHVAEDAQAASPSQREREHGGGDALPEPTGGLEPRARETLEHLLTGASEKQIAPRLGVSQHTVHMYVKKIYKRFGVSSRAELLARCLHR